MEENRKAELASIHRQVKRELAGCVQFWLEHGIDPVNGGVYTCLDREGRVYSTDKSVWMQGRCAWIFARLCNVYGPRPEWRDAAKSCLDFLEAHCINRAAGNRMYFTVTADGRPLRQRRYCFSEAFYAMACAEYALLTSEAAWMARARAAYDLIWQLHNGLMEDPVPLGPKTIPETRKGRALADPMIYLNLCAVMRRCDGANAAVYNERAAKCADVILQYHLKPELETTLETVGMQGEFWPDVSAGRIVNPGHDIECAWFLMEYACQSGDAAARAGALQMFDYAYASGWDEEYGGLLYYVDALGHPPEAYEHDMKLWWPHNELLIASLLFWKETGEDKYLEIFTQAWNYCMRVFHDDAHAEWFGYLRRDGKPTLPAAKGSTFKGPFHLPRMLVMVDGMLEHLA